ncbi:hypothetical protein RFI_39109 [Reticulomyxa filosa]|uniref:Uncharacterized protein n=1 Tax=Reticulomyxa filosa TaxID=46433 RepID=X6LBB5_RETFI|nr:hypothetical protein RFI_39109 [Reticulomyxa filosa]|eukprot:ETN98401.1 hypothetical protein RFI_39109 [Reticulomyxa filosa]
MKMVQSVSTHKLGTRAETDRVRTHIRNIGSWSVLLFNSWQDFTCSIQESCAAKLRKISPRRKKDLMIHKVEKEGVGVDEKNIVKASSPRRKRTWYVVKSCGEVVAKLRQHRSNQEEKDYEDEEKKKKCVAVRSIVNNDLYQHIRTKASTEWSARHSSKEGVKLQSIGTNEQGTLGRFENCANFDKALVPKLAVYVRTFALDDVLDRNQESEKKEYGDEEKKNNIKYVSSWICLKEKKKESNWPALLKLVSYLFFTYRNAQNRHSRTYTNFPLRASMESIK